MQNVVIRTSRSLINKCSQTLSAVKWQQETFSKTKYEQNIKEHGSAKTETKQKTSQSNMCWSVSVSRAQPFLSHGGDLSGFKSSWMKSESSGCPALRSSFITCISMKFGADCVLCRISRLCNNRLSSVRLDWHRASSENWIHKHSQHEESCPLLSGFFRLPEG